MTSPNLDPADFLMGGGVKSAKFFGRNNPVTGRILRDPEVRQQTDFNTKEPKFFKNGDPMMQLVVQVQTDQRDEQDSTDDGVRAFYIKGKQLTGVVRDAVRDAGGRGLEVGGTLTLTWISGGPRYDGDTTWQKESPKVYTAQYVRPVSQAAANFLNSEQPAAAPVSPAPAGYATAPAGQSVANVAPAGVDQAIWDQMSGEQRTKLVAAMGAR